MSLSLGHRIGGKKFDIPDFLSPAKKEELSWRMTGFYSDKTKYIAMSVIGAISLFAATYGIPSATSLTLGSIVLGKIVKKYGTYQFLHAGTDSKVNTLARSMFWGSTIPAICLGSSLVGVLGAGALPFAAALGFVYFMKAFSLRGTSAANLFHDLEFLQNKLAAAGQPEQVKPALLDTYLNRMGGLLSMRAAFEKQVGKATLEEYYTSLPPRVILEQLGKNSLSKPDRSSFSLLQRHLQIISSLDLSPQERKEFEIKKNQLILLASKESPLPGVFREDRPVVVCANLAPQVTGIASKILSGISVATLLGGAAFAAYHLPLAGLAVSVLSFSASNFFEMRAKKEFLSFDPLQTGSVKAEAVARSLFWSNLAWNVGLLSAAISLVGFSPPQTLVEKIAAGGLVAQTVFFANALLGYDFFANFTIRPGLHTLPAFNLNFLLKTLSTLHENLRQAHQAGQPQIVEMAGALFDINKSFFVPFSFQKIPHPNFPRSNTSSPAWEGIDIEGLFALVEDARGKTADISLETYLKLLPPSLFLVACKKSLTVHYRVDFEKLSKKLAQVPPFTDEYDSAAWANLLAEVEKFKNKNKASKAKDDQHIPLIF